MTLAESVRKIPQWKIEEVEYLTKLFREYPVFAIADITGFPTKHLQILRKKLSGRVVFRVSRNKLVLIAMKRAGIDTSLFEKILSGSNLLLFTKMNAFELYGEIEKHKSKTYYKPGEIADKEIVIPEGDTGIPPGPMLSVFGKLKIPTRVQANTIVVAKDTVVAKPGDKISEDLASLLQKLDLPLKEVLLKIKYVYDRGVVIPGDRLKIDINEYVDSILKAQIQAINLGVEIVWPERQILERVIVKAYREARAIVVESSFITSETIDEIIRSAHFKAYMLAIELSKWGVDIGIKIEKPIIEEKREEKVVKKEEREEEEKEKTVSEEELAEGLGAIFG
ncbi:MAG: 50S ribosomal protein L10 [Desulfurococcaceae archaeon]